MSSLIKFGEIPGINEGDWFKGRKEMMSTSFHRKWASGIDGNANEGTSAIVLSGGYEDDKDEGDEIIYTGAGGNDSNSGKQISDQKWENPGNSGLASAVAYVLSAVPYGPVIGPIEYTDNILSPLTGPELVSVL